jgi:cytosine/adenosine deaminase-related metal-dependent hydrolase
VTSPLPHEPVLALAGRRIDAPDAECRFPAESTAMVRQGLRALMAAHQARALVCSAAAGCDLLALDAALELGLRPRIVLPFDRVRFRETSVVDRPGDFGRLFDRILDVAEAKGDVVLLEGPAAGGAPYRACNEAILEEAARLARPDPPVAVIAWDGRSHGTDDDTAAFASAARRRGWTVLEVLTSRRAPAGSHRR